MGDDASFVVSNVRHGVSNGAFFIANDDGTYDKVGVVSDIGFSESFDIKDPETSAFASILADIPCQSFRFDVKWWSINRFVSLFSERIPYTVRRLRRNGKSHRR